MAKVDICQCRPRSKGEPDMANGGCGGVGSKGRPLPLPREASQALQKAAAEAWVALVDLYHFYPQGEGEPGMAKGRLRRRGRQKVDSWNRTPI